MSRKVIRLFWVCLVGLALVGLGSQFGWAAKKASRPQKASAVSKLPSPGYSTDIVMGGITYSCVWNRDEWQYVNPGQRVKFWSRFGIKNESNAPTSYRCLFHVWSNRPGLQIKYVPVYHAKGPFSLAMEGWVDVGTDLNRDLRILDKYLWLDFPSSGISLNGQLIPGYHVDRGPLGRTVRMVRSIPKWGKSIIEPERERVGEEDADLYFSLGGECGAIIPTNAPQGTIYKVRFSVKGRNWAYTFPGSLNLFVRGNPVKTPPILTLKDFEEILLKSRQQKAGNAVGEQKLIYKKDGTTEAGVIEEGSAPVSPSDKFTPLVKGLNSICIINTPSPLQATEDNVIPLASMGPKETIIAMAASYGNGRIVALGCDGFFSDNNLVNSDNKQFAINIIDWLSKPLNKYKVMITIGHDEQVDAGTGYSKSILEERKYTVITYFMNITAASLWDVNMVIVGTAWGEISPEEIGVLQEYVRQGGGLLLTGTGWSWCQHHNGTINSFPMNKIGELYGIQWTDRKEENRSVFKVFYPDTK